MSCTTTEIKSFSLDKTVRLSVEFRDAAGTLTDPTTLEFKIKSPDDAPVVTYIYGTDAELVRDAAGKFHVDYDVDVSGTWYYRYKATNGSLKETVEKEFVVARSHFA